MLSPVLAGEKSFDEIVINGPDWYSGNAITLITGDPVVSIDRRMRTLVARRSEEHTSEFQSLMRISYAVFCLIHKTHIHTPSFYQKLLSFTIPHMYSHYSHDA